MKNIYLSLVACLISISFLNAQLTLTKAFNEPSIGDVNISHRWDSTTALLNDIGPGTLWDFSSLTTNTGVTISTFTTVSSSTNAATFPNANLAEYDGFGGYRFWKSTSSPTTQLELLGIDQPSLSINLNTNSAITNVWPISLYYNKTDAFNGTAAAQTPTGNLTGTASGKVKTYASGTGTVILPGGLTYTNVLQVTVTQTINVNLLFGLVTVNLLSTNYQYYHASEKYPIISINYQTISGAFSGSTAGITINNNVIQGIEESLKNFNFSVYPNPASNKLNIKLSNNKAENVLVKIINSIGQTVKSIDLGNSSEINNEINLTDLEKGIYFVKTTVGTASSTKKIFKD